MNKLHKSCEKMHMAIVLSSRLVYSALVSQSRFGLKAQPRILRLVLRKNHLALKTMPYAYLVDTAINHQDSYHSLLLHSLQRVAFVISKHRNMFN